MQLTHLFISMEGNAEQFIRRAYDNVNGRTARAVIPCADWSFIGFYIMVVFAKRA